MKTLDLSAVTPSVGIIPQKDTVEHITSSYLEGVASLAKSMIPTSWQTGKLVILHGCVATGSNPGARTLTAGAVFYNGEVYQVPSASFTTTGSQIGIWTLQDVNTGTESKLTDGSDVHILVNNKFVFAAGLAGSGDFDENSTNVINYFNGFSNATLESASISSYTSTFTLNTSEILKKANVTNINIFLVIGPLTLADASAINSYGSIQFVIELPTNYKVNIGTGSSVCHKDGVTKRLTWSTATSNIQFNAFMDDAVVGETVYIDFNNTFISN